MGDMVLQSGTTAIYPDGNIIGENDIGAQVDAINDIAKDNGLSRVALEDEVRTRIYVTDESAEDAMLSAGISVIFGRQRRWSKSADWRARRS